MAMTTGEFGEFLFPLLKEVYGASFDQHPEMFSKMVDVEESDQEFEDIQELVGLGKVPEYSEGGPLSLDAFRLGIKTRYEVHDFSLGFEITRQLMRGDKSRQVRMMPEALGEAVKRTVETYVANIFVNGFSSNHPVEGVPLFSSAHPTDVGTSSNRPTDDNGTDIAVDPTMSGWQQMRVDIGNWKDSRGELYQCGPELVFGNQYLETSFVRILKSDGDPSTAARSINPHQGSMPGGYMINPYLTSTRAWYVKTTNRRGGARWIWREKPEFLEVSVQGRFVRQYAVHFAAMYGWDNFRKYWGSPGIT